MAAKIKASQGTVTKSVPKSVPVKPLASPTPGQPLTMEERLHRIEALGKRIESYVQFMCQIPNMTGTSSEVKNRAVTVFFDQLVIVEAQLAHIHDELRLE